MRAPNSTPMVRSCTGWKRLSVNCNSKQDLPTAQTHTERAVQAEGTNQRSAEAGKLLGRSDSLSDSADRAVSCPVRLLLLLLSVSCPRTHTGVPDDDVFEEVGVAHRDGDGRAEAGAEREATQPNDERRAIEAVDRRCGGCANEEGLSGSTEEGVSGTECGCSLLLDRSASSFSASARHDSGQKGGGRGGGAAMLSEHTHRRQGPHDAPSLSPLDWLTIGIP